jgi:hypothetical protein
LQPNTLNNVLSRSLTVEFRTGTGGQTADTQQR